MPLEPGELIDRMFIAYRVEIGGDFFYTIRFEDGRVRAIGLFGDRGQAEAALAGG